MVRIARFARSLTLALLTTGALGLPAAAQASVHITEFPARAGSGPTGITAGPDGNVWFTETYADRIGRITPSGAVTEFTAGITAGAQPDQIAAGPDGNLWFTEHNARNIGRITPAGVVTEFPIGAIAFGIAPGPDGRMWFTAGYAPWTTGATVGAIDSSGGLYQRVAFLTMTYPYESGGIAAGPSGDMWFLQTAGNDLGRVTTGGTLTSWPIWSHGSTPGAYLNNIVLGPDGNMWASGLSGTITRITDAGTATEFPVSPGVVSIPEDVAAGPDGNMWFTAIGLNSVGRISPTTGAITLTSTGIAPSSRLWDIAAGPDGNMWFTEQGTDRIARVTIDVPGVPHALTNAAGDLTTAGAALRATVDPSGVATDVHFEYGPTTAYGAQTATQSLTGSVDAEVSATLGGLQPGTTYHYRVVAEGGGRTIRGDDRTLRTVAIAPPPPTAPPVVPPAAATTTTPPPATVAPTASPTPVTARCAARAVTVSWTAPAGLRLRSLTLAGGGRTVRPAGRARTAQVTLDPGDGRTATLRATATTTRGVRLRATRTVAVCGTGAVGAKGVRLALKR